MTDQKKQFPELTKATLVQDIALGMVHQDGVPKSAPLPAMVGGFKTVADLTADVGLSYSTVDAGSVVVAGYTRYEVVASGTASPDVTTAGGVKLNALAGAFDASLYLPLTGGDITGDTKQKGGSKKRFESADGTKNGSIFQTDGDALNIDATKVTINSEPILDIANVADYGAVADGVTDDQAAIASAIATGKTVLIPPGTYAIGSGLTVSTANQVIIGYGATLLKTTTGFVGVTVTGTRAKVLGLSVDGGNYTNSGFHVTGDQAVLRDCYATNCQDGFHVDGPTAVPGADFVTLDRCWAELNNSSGFFLDNMTDGFLSNCISQANDGHGYYLTDQSYLMKMTNCVGDSNGRGGTGYANLYITRGDSFRAVNCTFSNCNNSGHGVWLNPTEGVSQTGFALVACGMGQNAGYGVYIDNNGGANNTHKVSISECRITGNTVGSVYVASGCANNVILANDLGGSAPVDNGTSTKIQLNDVGNIPTFQGAMVKLAASLPTFDASTSDTLIPFTAEEFDTDTMHDNSTNNTRITIPTGWTKARITAGAYAGSATTGQYASLRILKNGSAGWIGAAQTQNYVANSLFRMNVATGVVSVTGGDYFEAGLFSGGDNSINLISNGTFLSVERVQ